MEYFIPTYQNSIFIFFSQHSSIFFNLNCFDAIVDDGMLEAQVISSCPTVGLSYVIMFCFHIFHKIQLEGTLLQMVNSRIEFSANGFFVIDAGAIFRVMEMEVFSQVQWRLR